MILVIGHVIIGAKHAERKFVMIVQEMGQHFVLNVIVQKDFADFVIISHAIVVNIVIWRYATTTNQMSIVIIQYVATVTPLVKKFNVINVIIYYVVKSLVIDVKLAKKHYVPFVCNLIMNHVMTAINVHYSLHIIKHYPSRYCLLQESH